MPCEHPSFVEIDRVSQPDPAAPVAAMRSIFGVKVGCPHCGEIRNLWPDGRLEVAAKGNGHDAAG